MSGGKSTSPLPVRATGMSEHRSGVCARAGHEIYRTPPRNYETLAPPPHLELGSDARRDRIARVCSCRLRPLDASHTEALRAFGYELIELLGKGGMGRVWRARERDLERDVAIKVLAVDDVLPRHRHRFLLEARALARIQHPNVVVVYRLGEILGLPFLAYELIDGVGVDQLIGSLRWPRALAIAVDLARGLAAAHHAGVLHRDLKPANAMVTADGTAKLIDFGLAKLLHNSTGDESDAFDDEVTVPSGPSARLTDETLTSGETAGRAAAVDEDDITRHGALLGTPRYIAPELWNGARASPQTDVYTLGLIIWELLTHHQAHVTTDGVEALRAQIRTPLDSVCTLRPEVPPELGAVIDRAVRKDPSTRLSSASELCAALELLSDELRVGSRLRRRSAHGLDLDELGPLPDANECTIAVLPFASSGGEEATYLAEGLTEELVDNLADTPELEVRPRASTESHAGRSDIEAVGRELGVQLLVDGSVRRIGERIRIRARVLSTVDGSTLASKRFDCTLGDLFAVSDDVAATVVGVIEQRLAARRSALEELTPTKHDGVSDTQSLEDDGWDPTGVDVYLQARHELRRNWHTDVSTAIELFDEALARLPGSPRVLAGAAIAYARLAFIGGPGDAERALVAVEFAERAIAIDPTRSEPHYALAMYHFNSGVPMSAIVALERALELAPANAEVHDLFGRVLLELDDLELAIEHLEIAHRLSPQEANTRFDLVRAYAIAGAWDKSDMLLTPPTGNELDDAVLTLTCARVDLWRDEPKWLPDDDSDLGDTLVGDITRILRAAARAEQLDLRLVDRLANLANAAAGAPRRRILMNQFLAEVAARADAMDVAFAAIEQAVEVGLSDLTWLRRCPLFAPLRDQPRFVSMCDELTARVRG